MIPVYITQIIGEVVAKVEDNILETIKENETAALGSTGIQKINFQHGHKRELLETLAQMDQSSEERELKYPLVYLVQDFSEERGRSVGIYADTSLNIIIAHHTVNTDKITDRETKVFYPVLYPIYYELMEQLTKHKGIFDSYLDMIRHRKTDRAYWGRNAIGGTDATKLKDYVDAIELENLQLKINFKIC